MRKRATAQDVADLAGVSKRTVIRAFTPGSSIKDDKKRRILDAASSLNYSPNLLARSLATNSTHLIGIFVDDFSNPAKLPFLDVLTDRLQAEGLMAVLININNHYGHVHALLSAEQRQMDAIVLLGTAFRNETLTDRSLGRQMPPTYVLARDSQLADVTAVVCDAEHALNEIVDHLHSRGYRKPAFMTGASVLSTALKRRQHFADFWLEKGVSDVQSLSASKYSAREGADSIRTYLASTSAENRADVIMCENDILAMGALSVIRKEFGLRVPEDIAVVGFDNYELCDDATYGLTTFEQPVHAMVNVLVDMITGKSEQQSSSVKGRLIIRSTT